MTAITAQKFFLMPLAPTPNGLLPVGHIARPYGCMHRPWRYLRSQGYSVEVVNVDLACALDSRIGLALANLHHNQLQFIAPGLLPCLESAVALQTRAFRLDAVSVRAAWEVLHRWMQAPALDVTQPADSYVWLKGLADLAAPVMPRLAEYVWQRLGHDGLPVIQNLYAASLPGPASSPRTRFAPMSLAALAPCLPASGVLAGATSDA